METSRSPNLVDPLLACGKTTSGGVSYRTENSAEETPGNQFADQHNTTSTSTNPIRDANHHPNGIGGLIGITLPQALQGYRNPTAMEACQQYERQMEMCAESKARNATDLRMAEAAYIEQIKWANAQATRGDNAARLRAQQAKDNAHICADKQASTVVPIQSRVSQHQVHVSSSQQETHHQDSKDTNVKAAYEKHLRIIQGKGQRTAPGVTAPAVNNPVADMSMIDLGNGTYAKQQTYHKSLQQTSPPRHATNQAQTYRNIANHLTPPSTSTSFRTPSWLVNVHGNAMLSSSAQSKPTATQGETLLVSTSHLSSDPRSSEQPQQYHTLPSPATSTPDSYHSPTKMAKPTSMSGKSCFPSTPQSRKGSFEFQKIMTADVPDNRFYFTKQSKQIERKVPRINGQPLQTTERPSPKVTGTIALPTVQTDCMNLKFSKAVTIPHACHVINPDEFDSQSGIMMTQDAKAKIFIQELEKKMGGMRTQIMAAEKDKRITAASIEAHLAHLKQSSKEYLDQDAEIRHLMCLYDSTLQESVKPIAAEAARYHIIKRHLIPPLTPQILSSIAEAAVHNFGFPNVRKDANTVKSAIILQSHPNIDPALLFQGHKKVAPFHNTQTLDRDSGPARSTSVVLNKQHDFDHVRAGQQPQESPITGHAIQNVLRASMVPAGEHQLTPRKRPAYDVSGQHSGRDGTSHEAKKFKPSEGDLATTTIVDLTGPEEHVGIFSNMTNHTQSVKQDFVSHHQSDQPSVSLHPENAASGLRGMPVFHPVSWHQESVSQPSSPPSSQRGISFEGIVEQSDNANPISPRTTVAPTLDSAAIQAELHGVLGMSDTTGENVTTAFDADIDRAFKEIFENVPDVFGNTPVLPELSDEDLGLDFTWHDSQPDPM